MENKINKGRVILGGLVGGVVILLVSFVIHGIFLKDHYTFFQTSGVILKEPRMMYMHSIYVIFSGIPIAALYAISRKYLGPGPKTAIIVALLLSLLALGGPAAMYTFYNSGGMIPFMTFIGILTGYILAALVAGWLYKD